MRHIKNWKSPVMLVDTLKPPADSPGAVAVEAALVMANEGMRGAAGALWSALEEARAAWGEDSVQAIRLEQWLHEVNRLHHRLPGGYEAL